MWVDWVFPAVLPVLLGKQNPGDELGAKLTPINKPSQFSEVSVTYSERADTQWLENSKLLTFTLLRHVFWPF